MEQKPESDTFLATQGELINYLVSEGLKHIKVTPSRMGDSITDSIRPPEWPEPEHTKKSID